MEKRSRNMLIIVITCVSPGNDDKLCRQDGGAEDAELGKCMEKLGVKTANTTDKLGRSRFHCFDPATHLFGGYPDWYYKYDANGARKVCFGLESSPRLSYDARFVGLVIRGLPRERQTWV